MSLTEEDKVEYEQGGSITSMEEVTENSRIGVVRGQTIGHMLRMLPYQAALGWTRYYLLDARRERIDADIATGVRKWKHVFEKALLTRFFTTTEHQIGGTSGTGYDVPFVHGTSGNVDYAPPEYEGSTFTTSHDHFNYHNSSASETLADVLEDAAADLFEHGHMPPYTAMVSGADIASYLALDNIIKKVAPIVENLFSGLTEGRAVLDQPMWDGPGNLFAYYDSPYGQINLYANNRIPTGYAGMYKSYGAMTAANPLAVRVHPDVGFGAYIVTPGQPAMNGLYMGGVIFEALFGVGIGRDRTNGVASYLAAGAASYTNPTIS
ncbi:MAG: hypothetical protein WC683_14115 [bacterium]